MGNNPTAFATSNKNEGLVQQYQSKLEKLDKYLDKYDEVPDFPNQHEWLNTQENIDLSLHKQLKNKVVVVDFWSSCCINCIHVLEEINYLEDIFAGHPEIAFVGCHSAKFANEKDLHMLKQAVVRYDIKHPVFNDKNFIFWESQGVNCWPTIVVIGPHRKAILNVQGEDNKEDVEAMLWAALGHYKDKLDKSPLPIELEKDKWLAQVDNSKKIAMRPEEIRALKQNLNNPGKVIAITDAENLPYDGVTDIFAIADSGNNRFIVVDGNTLECLEVIGNGKIGFKDGAFSEAEFHHTQGMAHFINKLGQHCLLVCDTKNHCIREVNLHTKQVRKVVGIPGIRGSDREGGKVPADKQQIASPWDLLKIDEGVFIVAMAGTHQIWIYDQNKDICYRYSGSAGEGNLNSGPYDSQWAQPSGITMGDWNGELYYFIADSESSCVRAIRAKDNKAIGLAGGDANYRNLFAFGDEDGVGYKARLQHPIGVYYCHQNNTLYVADSYNHKIKVMDFARKDTPPITSWIGTSKDKNPRVVDGNKPLLNEPNGIFGHIQKGELKGLLIADTGNNCVRYARLNGEIKTLEINGIPDVRLTDGCRDGVCKPNL